MMAGLPSEARERVIAQETTEDENYWLCSSYREYYGIPNFQTNPTMDGIDWAYAKCLDCLDVSDIVPMLNSLIRERQNG